MCDFAINKKMKDKTWRKDTCQNIRKIHIDIHIWGDEEQILNKQQSIVESSVLESSCLDERDRKYCLR